MVDSSKLNSLHLAGNVCIASISSITGCKTYALGFESNDNIFQVDEDTIATRSIANKQSFKTSDNQILYPLFDTTKVCYKSALYSRSKTERDGTTYDFQNVFSHDVCEPFVDVISHNGAIYSLEQPHANSHVTLDDDSYSYLSVDNGLYSLPSAYIDTTIYDKAKVVSALSSKNTSIDVAHHNLNGVKYNNVYEFIGNIPVDQYSGNIAANSFKTKNNYNAKFDMCHYSNTVLSSARMYYGISKCNDQICLKYFDNANYRKNGQTYLVEEPTASQRYYYPQIDAIHSIARGQQSNAHKSELYSIHVMTDRITDDVSTRSSIASTIKDIAQTLAPANAQLLDVTISKN